MNKDLLEDILVHRKLVFSAEIDSIIWDLAELFAEHELRALVDWSAPPPLDKLQLKLIKSREERIREAREREWDRSRISKNGIN